MSKRTAETDATWDNAPSRGNVHEAERRRAARLESEDALYGPPLSVPAQVAAVVAAAVAAPSPVAAPAPAPLMLPLSSFPKTKGITLEETKQYPYNQVPIYRKPEPREVITLEDVWWADTKEEATTAKEATREATREEETGEEAPTNEQHETRKKNNK